MSTKNRAPKAPKNKSILLLCRHGEGTHITGTFNEKKDGAIGPSLTGTFKDGEWHGGKGEAFRRVARQLNKMKITPDIILSSPQLRAIETAVFARMNRVKLSNGKTLYDIPFRILRKQGISVHEQTKQLEGQGMIIPSTKDASKKWPNWDQISADEGVLNEVERKLSDTPRQPPPDPSGSSLDRAKRILEHLETAEKYAQKVVLIIAHDGILRDIIRAKTGVDRYEDTFDFCEIRTSSGSLTVSDSPHATKKSPSIKKSPKKKKKSKSPSKKRKSKTQKGN